MNKQPSVVLIQHWNHRYVEPQNRKDLRADQREAAEKEALYSYKVDRLKNTLVPFIGTYLTPEQVQELIDNGVDVSIQPVK